MIIDFDLSIILPIFVLYVSRTIWIFAPFFNKNIKGENYSFRSSIWNGY